MLAANVARAVLTSSRLKLIDWRGTAHEVGPPGAPLVGTLAIKTRRAALRIGLDPQMALGEAYMDGDLEVVDGDLSTIVTAILRDGAGRRPPWFLRMRQQLLQALRVWHERNSPAEARRHIAHHYDLDYDFYRLWLDAEMHYSCAFFTSPDMTLEQAQEEKARRIAAKLALEPGQTVLDIGCGWGAMALHLARRHNVRVVGLSLSREQLAIAERRAAREGLSDRVSFRYEDYREHDARYDRIVSIGMLEHVGAPNLGDYFRVVRRNLHEDGVALIHTIGRVAPPAPTAAWIRRYIFPGGFLPSLSEVSTAVERHRLFTTDVEVLRLHYAYTLKEWRRRANERRDEIAGRYGERFRRMWDFYLAISEASFLSGMHVNYQLQLTRRLDALPLSRDYLYAREEIPEPLLAARASNRRAAAVRRARNGGVGRPRAPSSSEA
jgi:cyclopropane-fatty-acyl-phospholipid synthase